VNSKIKASGAGPIIMVDDSESDAFLARKCYERSKLDRVFLTLRSGEALIEYLEGVHAGTNAMPALVLLDINMPGKSGFETLAEIRAVSDFADMPIITMLTTSDDPRDANKSAELGADGFFTKPSDIADYIGFFDRLAP
jgi:CheY-like chemotaxis protein